MPDPAVQFRGQGAVATQRGAIPARGGQAYKRPRQGGEGLRFGGFIVF